jgi:hypothetical protein
MYVSLRCEIFVIFFTLAEICVKTLMSYECIKFNIVLCLIHVFTKEDALFLYVCVHLL